MIRRASIFAGALLLGAAARADSILITGARVADGSGGPLRERRTSGSTAIEFARSARSGRGRASGSFGPRGLVLAPGFIDIHNHSTSGLGTDPQAASQVSQGITTLAIGADGESPWPLGGLSRRAAAGAARGQRRRLRGTRDRPRKGDGRRLQARRQTRRDRPDGGARRGGDASGRGRPLLRARVRGRQLQHDRRARRALPSGRAPRRDLHEPHPRRGRQELRSVSGGPGDRAQGRDTRPDLPHQTGDGRGLGPSLRGRGPVREGARRGPGRHRGLLPVRGLAREHRSARAQQEI